MKKLILINLLCLSALMSFAQSVTEAVRYSFQEPIGTARVAGVGGAFGAMGGDYGVLAINPAGIADYWKSEFTFTPTFSSIETEATLSGSEGANITNNNSLLSINNIGVVFSHRPRGGSLVTSNLAIGFRRTGSFKQTMYYEGYTEGSITERFKELANGKSPAQLDDFEAYPAWFTDAIFDLEEDNTYSSDISSIASVDKSQNIIRKGRSSEVDVAWAGKYGKSLNFGVGLGIPLISFEETKTYRETDPNDEIEIFNSLEYIENITTSGTGVNVKVGAQYSAFNFLRLGASLQTPSYMYMEDTYDTSLEYSYTLSSTSEPYLSPIGSFNYRIRTPWKANLSAGGLFRLENINAFINADVELLDYRIASLDFNGNDEVLEREANEQIDLQLANTVNYRLGGEIAYKKLRVRAGTALTASPYDLDEGNLATAGSFGLGFRGDKFFMDLAYRSNSVEEGYIPYLVVDPDRNQLVTSNKRSNNLLITVGFKF